MGSTEFVSDLLGELESIAANNGFTWVTRVEMVIGTMHGATAETLTEEFKRRFDGTKFEDAEVKVTVVSAGQQMKAPTRDEMMTTNGWEVLVTRLEGTK